MKLTRGAGAPVEHLGSDVLDRLDIDARQYIPSVLP